MGPLVTRHHPGSLRIPAPEDAVGTPIDSPATGLPPSYFRDGEVLTFQYATELSAIRALLPEPLEPVNDVVQVQVSRWGDVPGVGRDIHECNVMVAARYQGDGGPVEGSYSPYFWVESDRAMAGGREFHGQPKRIAEIIVECYEGPCTVEIRPTATAPLYRLPARLFLEGFYWRADFRMVGGRILHDYLTGGRR